MRKKAFKKLVLCLVALVTAALLASCGNGGETADSATPTRGASDPDLPTPGGLIMPEDDLSGLGEYSDGPAVSDPASAEPGADSGHAADTVSVSPAADTANPGGADASGGQSADTAKGDTRISDPAEDPLAPDTSSPSADTGNGDPGGAETDFKQIIDDIINGNGDEPVELPFDPFD